MLKIFSAFCFVLLLFAVAQAQNKPGVIDGSVSTVPQSLDQSARSTADWYTTVQMDTMPGANFKVTTAFGVKALLKGVYNNSATTGTFKYRPAYVFGSNTTTTIKLPAYGWSGKLPSVDTVFSTGTSDSLLYFMQYQ